jgi:hypothetical protein
VREGNGNPAHFDPLKTMSYPKKYYKGTGETNHRADDYLVINKLILTF